MWFNIYKLTQRTEQKKTGTKIKKPTVLKTLTSSKPSAALLDPLVVCVFNVFTISVYYQDALSLTFEKHHKKIFFKKHFLLF